MVISYKWISREIKSNGRLTRITIVSPLILLAACGGGRDKTPDIPEQSIPRESLEVGQLVCAHFKDDSAQFSETWEINRLPYQVDQQERDKWVSPNDTYPTMVVGEWVMRVERYDEFIDHFQLSDDDTWIMLAAEFYPELALPERPIRRQIVLTDGPCSKVEFGP